MRVVLLHPPLYLTNYSLYHELGKLCELTCYVFGDRPVEHPTWTLKEYYQAAKHSFRLRQFGTGSYPKKQIYSGSFLRFLAEDRPHIVITIAFAPYGFYAALGKKRYNYQLFLLTNATTVSDGHISFAKKCSRKLLLHNCNHAISASPATNDYLHALSPKLPLHLSIQTIDVEFFQQHAAPYWQMSRTQLRKLLREKLIQNQYFTGESDSPDWDSAPMLLGVGRFVPGKNWQHGLQHLAQLPKLHYLLVGSGPEEELYKESAKRLGVLQRFHILPFAQPEELILYYCVSDLFYFPSESETFGFVLAEALTCGLPSICSSGAGAKVLIEEGQTGWCYPLEQTPNSDTLLKYCRMAQEPEMKEYCRNFMKQHTNQNRAKEILRALKTQI